MTTMTQSRGRSRRGGLLVEFLFAGIPVLFTIISVVEIARAMWTEETLSYAVSEAARLAVVHGVNCVTAPHNCPITVANIAQRIGLSTDQMNVTLSSTGGGASVNCTPLSSCLANSGVWPAAPGNTLASDVIVTASYPFDSPMGFFFPGVGGTAPFATTYLPATSQQRIQF